jgi:hypothetical protein
VNENFSFNSRDSTTLRIKYKMNGKKSWSKDEGKEGTRKDHQSS